MATIIITLYTQIKEKDTKIMSKISKETKFAD